MKLLNLALIFLACFTACAQQTEVLSSVYFPDVETAKVIICSDETDGFFEEIRLADLSIQLKDNRYTSEQYLDAMLDYYRLLQDEVAPFTDLEKEKLQLIFDRATEEIGKINPALFPDSINLIKIQGIAYGPGAFYTRENGIYIPGGSIYQMTDDQLYHVMLHEIFHIISRYDINLRHELYEIVHYFPVKDSICIPEKTNQRILLNPDGADYRYAIDLTLNTGEVMRMIPLITATDTLYNESKRQFFGHIKFGLFPLVERDTSCQTLVIDPNGFSILPDDIMSTYQEKVGDITRYNIHPDELMADHFAAAVIAFATNDFSSFSEQGKESLQRVISVLSEN